MTKRLLSLFLIIIITASCSYFSNKENKSKSDKKEIRLVSFGKVVEKKSYQIIKAENENKVVIYKKTSNWYLGSTKVLRRKLKKIPYFKEMSPMKIAKIVSETGEDIIASVLNDALSDRYVVKRGDCIWNISKKIYGHGIPWVVIYNDNKKIIGKNPDMIYPNQSFVIRKKITKKMLVSVLKQILNIQGH